MTLTHRDQEVVDLTLGQITVKWLLLGWLNMDR